MHPVLVRATQPHTRNAEQQRAGTLGQRARTSAVQSPRTPRTLRNAPPSSSA
ncbi:hypothetical protein SCP_0806470 [Sparassis crispa]|uniref:Uncharacterized protein n=1 Tax=Sparassis crispa TaxID=139825 RepID=A0A401GVA7_9APHY|nr:hypothetical protein SCP_0215030 [Sparassis crispa]XP_027617036.1 hypothetical protein SCP_0806470 [Sparassis crispa]GBE80284.1 hypothetical protein SCP_0215030 [Sparassis crispa]GBE86123.1 hypothetical protein SCP_0806470 [Sparassis crispa]